MSNEGMSATRPPWQPWQIVLLLLSNLPALISASDCDVTVNAITHPDGGTFTSPNYPHGYGNNLRCIYTFTGRPNQRVKVQFLEFSVKGVPPRCSHDYVDVYTQLARPDESLLEVPLHGRYCGHSVDELPHLLISMQDVFILIFYTDPGKSDRGFKATYEFIDASIYMIGTPASPPLCGQTIHSSKLSTGNLLSPTYPGVYPDNIFCFYKLQGIPGQRIRFTFVDLDLYSGGEHCPFDYVRIFDGQTKEDPEIGTYCGKHNDVDVYSTNAFLHIEFMTRSGRMEPTKRPYMPYWEISSENTVEQRGFNATFEISSRFVNLSFIHEGEHVRGTECDQRILSRGESNGTIISPNYPLPYPLGVRCLYFIDGLVNTQNLEKARLTFTEFNIPILNTNKRQCDNGEIEAYLEGQELADIKERNSRNRAVPNRKICGETTPAMLETSSPRLLLLFDTREASVAGRGFRAAYQFVTDYAIPGTPATEGACHFIYRSRTNKKSEGIFNSPRYPTNYPFNTECIYEFIGLPNEHLRITFDDFHIENRLGNCTTDNLQIFELDDKRQNASTLISKSCGNKMPGPVMSTTSRVLALFSTDAHVPRSGFRANYEFLSPNDTDTKICQVFNISSDGGGILYSPNHPHKYLLNTCHVWIIQASASNANILLTFESFIMEGSIDAQGHGCANAVLKVFTNHSSIPQNETCGRMDDTQPYEIISQRDYIKVQFISSKRAIGFKGFKITWTEIVRNTGNYGQSFCLNGFRCAVSQYCIASHLKCNDVHNCGASDSSDEDVTCSHDYTNQSVLHIILAIVLALIALVFIIVCILHRRRKIQKRKNRKEIEVRYVTRSVVANNHHNNHTQCIEDSNYYTAERTLLREKTEKVSIV